MKIIIIGDGKIGRAITEECSKEGHDVVVVDKNPGVIEDIIKKYDVNGIPGNGASYTTLKNAGASTAKVVVAATSSDETNVLSCVVAKNLGAKETIARVRDFEYSKQFELIQKDLKISKIINPELESANEIMRIINFPEAIRVDSFANGAVDLVELYVPKNNPLCGQSLIDIRKNYQTAILICSIVRGEEVIIPDGNTKIQPGDKISITAQKGNIRRFLKKLGLIEEKIKSVMIIGGGKIALYLGNLLVQNNYSVKIIEKEYERCKELKLMLPQAEIINGDGTNQELLNDEGMKTTDALVCLTGNDEENIIVSMYANSLSNSNKEMKKKIITKVSKSNFASIVSSIGGISVIKPSDLIAAQVISFIRARNNRMGNNIKTLYRLGDEIEAIEFNVVEKSKVVGKPIRELKKKNDIIIAVIIRGDEVIIPGGDDVIEQLDNVVVITPTSKMLVDINDIC